MCDCGKGVNPREILNLPMNETLTEQQVIAAYRKCALRCHPDKYKTKEATEIFQKINNARDKLLSNPAFLNARPAYAPPPPPPRPAYTPPRKQGYAPPPRPPPGFGFQKRCPNGTRRNKKTGMCISKNKAKTPSPKPRAKTPSPKPKAPSPKYNVKRCPNGTRKNPKTKICEPKK